MAKYKLSKEVAGSSRFRYNGNKYETHLVSQEILKKVFNDGFEHVSEIKESTKPVKNEQKKKSRPTD